MIGAVNARSKPAPFESLVGPPGLLHGTAEVPGAYTGEGWKLVEQRAAAYHRLQDRDPVMRAAFAGGQLPDLSGGVLGTYARDYSGAWARFVSGVALHSPPADLHARAEGTTSAAEPKSQLFKTVDGAAPE